MGASAVRAICGWTVAALCLTAAAANADLPAAGRYLTDLGLADLTIEGKGYRVAFDEVVDFEIRADGEDEVYIEAGEGSVPAVYLPLEFGSFAFAAQGDTLYFMPVEGNEEYVDPYLSSDEDSFTTYGGGGGEVKVPGGDRADRTAAEAGTAAASPNAPAEGEGKAPDTPAADGETMGDDYIGFRFSAPKEWKRESSAEGSFTLAPRRGKETMLVSTHVMNSVEELRNSLRAGINVEQVGTRLALDGPVLDLGENGVASKLRGTYRGKPVIAYNVALVSPHGGGATILAWSDPGDYSDDLAAAARAVAASVSFRMPKEHPEVARWKGELPGNRLSYMESNFTPGLSTDGYSTGSSYSIERHLDLCADGSFHYTESTDYSVDAGSAGNAGGANSDDHSGQWRVYRYNDLTVLELRYSTGGVGALVIAPGAGGGVTLDGEEWSVGGSPVCR